MNGPLCIANISGFRIWKNFQFEKFEQENGKNSFPIWVKYNQIEMNAVENWYKYLAPFIYIKHKKGEAK